MEAILKAFEQIVEKGGPEPSEYGRTNRLMDGIGELIRNGILATKQLPEIWNRFGEAFSLKTLQGHVCRKPYGYAGDFEIIEKMYVMKTAIEPHLVKWDTYFQNAKAVIAVRNRKEYFKKLLSRVEEERQGQPVNILNIGSGPGRDIYEYFTENPGTRINVDCVDLDKKAITYAKSLCTDYLDNITFHTRNALRFTPRRPYDLIWSAGLFDYLNDKLFTFLMKHLVNYLKADGELVIGNFSTRNPSISYMEFTQWILIHRSKKQLKSLALKSGINDLKISIGSEPEGINLFLHIEK